MSHRVASTNCRASDAVVNVCGRLCVSSRISEPVPMSPISPSTRIAGFTDLSAATASRPTTALKQHQIGHIEVANRHPVVLRLPENLSEFWHGNQPSVESLTPPPCLRI